MTKENRDFAFGLSYPRSEYAIIGSQLGRSLGDTNGKRPTHGPPMLINNHTPGQFMTTDREWSRTFGASLDSYLSVVNGKFVDESISSIQISDVYKDGMSNADDSNIWKLIPTTEGASQQVQYIVSKNTAEEGNSAVSSFGDIGELRGIGLRVPGMAAGWGRTIDLLPTDPNPTKDASGRKNDDEHKLARETWKHGPVDFRWDYRRQVWSTFNDLIADHEDQGLGTWVFSTNPDSAEGFPFLKGRLDDVWWVRQRDVYDSSDGKVENSQTAEIMTHLNHYWFDEDEDGAAPLKSIFIIPHTNSTSDCHEKGTENQLGNELTGSDDKIDIRTEAHFFKEKGVDGPIDFIDGRGEDVCCENDMSKYFTGSMLFLEQVPKCEGGKGDNIIGNETAVAIGSQADCKWVPAVKIDECELVGRHFTNLITNDISLAGNITATCDALRGCIAAICAAMDSNSQNIGSTLVCLNDAIQSIPALLDAVLLEAMDRVLAEVADSFAKHNDSICAAFAAMATSLAEGCDCVISAPCPKPPSIGHPGPPKMEIEKCPAPTLSPCPECDCAVCVPTSLIAPCNIPEMVVAGTPCGGATPTVDTEYGTCQTH